VLFVVSNLRLRRGALFKLVRLRLLRFARNDIPTSIPPLQGTRPNGLVSSAHPPPRCLATRNTRTVHRMSLRGAERRSNLNAASSNERSSAHVPGAKFYAAPRLRRNSSAFTVSCWPVAMSLTATCWLSRYSWPTITHFSAFWPEASLSCFDRPPGL
jgi:hypothetical protein